MLQDDIYLMISKYFSGETTKEEEQKLQAWLKESDENKRLFDESSRIWELSGNMKLELDSDQEQAWQRIQDQTRTRRKHFRISPMVVRVAASLLVLLVAGGLFFLFQAGENEHVYQTAVDQQHYLVLPDSSKVWLNEESKLSYSGDFENNRKLQLTGEAYFEVVSDPSRPFSVETPQMLTIVVGTSFNITARDGKPIEEVVVTSGKVKVSANSGDRQSLFLEPGTMVSFNRETGELQKSSNDDMNFLAWKEHRLQFRNTPLSELEQVLEQYFEVKISLEHQNIADCQFTSEFQDPTVEEVLQELAMTLDLSYTLENGEYFLTGTGCK